MTVRRLLRDKARPWLLAKQGAELSEVTMPAKRYKVTLEPDERGELETLISRGKAPHAINWSSPDATPLYMLV
jgi:hypothetical protein